MTGTLIRPLSEDMEMMILRTVSALILTLVTIGVGVSLFGQRSEDMDTERNFRTRLAVERLRADVDGHERRITLIEARPIADIQIAKLAAEVESLKWWVQSGIYGAGGLLGAGGLIAATRKRKREDEEPEERQS